MLISMLYPILIEMKFYSYRSAAFGLVYQLYYSSQIVIIEVY